MYASCKGQVGGATQYARGIAEQLANDPMEQQELTLIADQLTLINRQLTQLQQRQLGRELEYRITDPDGWELARSLGGQPVT
jgi:hypothetical protein